MLNLAQLKLSKWRCGGPDEHELWARFNSLFSYLLVVCWFFLLKQCSKIEHHSGHNIQYSVVRITPHTGFPREYIHTEIFCWLLFVEVHWFHEVTSCVRWAVWMYCTVFVQSHSAQSIQSWSVDVGKEQRGPASSGWQGIDSTADLLQWLRRLGLSELQCSEPGWLVRQGVGSSPTPASMSSQVSACNEIKFSGRYRGFACVLFKLWQAITPGLGASGVWWEPPVWITDGRGQQSYRAI